VRLFSKDVSTGDNKSAFGIAISDGSKLEKALCPKGMSSRKDRAGLASCFTDVMAMPGTYHRNAAVERSDMEVMMEGTVALVAQATGNSLVLPEGQWKSERKARLSSIQSSSDLLALWESLVESESEIFEQQDDRIRTYMHDRHYSSTEIDQFLASGLFMRVITDTYNNYKTLLQTLFSHNTVHGFNGLASELLKFHSGKLKQIRLFSQSYFQYLVRTYIYMREAAAAKFSHLNVLAPLVQDMYGRAIAEKPSGGGGGGGNGTNNDRCSYCQNKDCHSKLGIPVDSSKCPFRIAGITRSQCRKAAKAFVSAFNPSTDKEEAVKSAIEAAKTTPTP
jgi:hypothetical protein